MRVWIPFKNPKAFDDMSHIKLKMAVVSIGITFIE